MSGTFDAYAAYYDLLYADKDYAAESDWIHGLIQDLRPGASSLLELGCGTGGHALHLARKGYSITGIDLSERMVALANAHAGRETWNTTIPTFETADLRGYRSGRTHDVVVSLFHVMSYQVTNADIRAAMATAASHLAPGGLFIFDCWYGPGVLTDPPSTRVRRLQGEGFTVTRIAEPHHEPGENRVDVHYEILVQRGTSFERFHECHPMRYLFTPEVDLLLSEAGLERVGVSRWLDRSPPGAVDWNACYIARK